MRTTKLKSIAALLRRTAVALCVPLFVATACAGDADDKSRSAAGRDTRSAAALDTRSAAAFDTANAAADTVDDFGTRLPRDASDAERVVSLNPVFTEIVFAIGAGSRLVGRTSWDERPAAALAVKDVGAGIRPNVEAVLATRPTLVLLYATAENRAAADAFNRAGVRTLSLRTVTIADFRRAARALGVALGEANAAHALVDSVDRTLERVQEAVRDVERPRVVWPLWDSPVLAVGNESYEAELLDIAGAENIFADRKESASNVTIEEIAQRDPDILLAGPERTLRLRSSETWRAVRAVRDGRMLTLDSTVVGRPGVTIGMAAVSIARLLHPDRSDRLP